MNCSSVIPGLTQKKRLVVFVPCLKENVSPCGTFEMRGHSQEVTDVVALIVKKRSVKKRTKRIAKGENKAKNDAKGKGKAHSSNNSNMGNALRSCTRTWARLFRIFLLFLVTTMRPALGYEPSTGIQVREGGETQVEQLQRKLAATKQQCNKEVQDRQDQMQDQLCKAAPQHASCTGIEFRGAAAPRPTPDNEHSRGSRTNQVAHTMVAHKHMVSSAPRKASSTALTAPSNHRQHKTKIRRDFDFDHEAGKQVGLDHEDAKRVLKVQPPSGKAHHALRLMPPNGVDRSSFNPLVLLVDVSSGKDDPGCGKAAASQCASIGYALAQGQQQPPDQGLEVRVQPGNYLNECSLNGNEVTSPTSTAIKRADGTTAAVTIDCAGSGKFLNITQGPASVSTLEGLSIMGGSSQSSGGAVVVDGGALVLRGCAYVNCESLASTADGFFEGGGAVAMSRAVSLLLERVTFTNCRAPNGAGGAIKVGFGDELAKEAMGHEWWRSSAAEAETMGLLQSRFDRCSAGTKGGAVAVQVGTWTSSISTLVEDTAFEQSQLTTQRSSQGGSLSATFTTEVQDVTNTIRRTNMTDGVLSGSGFLKGGGAYWYYQKTAMNVHTLVTESIIRNMSLVGGGGGKGGGGLCMEMQYLAEAMNMSLVIEDSTIGGHTLQSAGGSLFGGSVYLNHGGPASSVVVAVRRSIMQANSLICSGSGYIQGAGLSMMMRDEATGVSTTIEDSTIGSHTLQSVGNNIYGGSVYLYHQGPNMGQRVSASSVVVAVRRSFMQANSLKVVGGSGNIRGAGLCMEMYAEAKNVSTFIEGSTIGGHTLHTVLGYVYGGSVLLFHGPGTAASSVVVAVRRSFMQANNITAGVEPTGQVRGAGLCMMMESQATGVSTTIEDSTIGGHTVQTAVGDTISHIYAGIYGGSVALLHGTEAPASSVVVAVRRSFVQANSLTTVGGSGNVRGAGLCMEMFSEATNVRTTIEDSTIGGHTVQTGGSAIEGGAVYLRCLGSVSDILMAFRNSIFEGNRGATLGGAVYIAMGAPYSQPRFVRTVFSDCRMLNNTASLHGGAIYHLMQYAGASLELHRCTILDNYAGVAGGGIFARQIAANPPTNLEMHSVWRRGDGYSCSAVYTGAGGHAREWGYGTSILFISASTVSNNGAGVDEAATDTLVASGGGIWAQNLNITAHNCEIAGNQVAGNGGAFYLNGGSARLSVKGNTSITRNAATREASVIYSASGGSITLSGTTIIDLIRGTAVAGITIVGGGKLEHGTNTQMRCAAGEELLYYVTTVPTAFSSWGIDCQEVRSNRAGGSEFINPTCVQLQSDPTSPLYTSPCAGLPLLPAMVSSSGTISCSPCPNNQYSLDRGSKQGVDAVRNIKCLECPYGATCAGGAGVGMKAGFWGMQAVEEEPSSPTPAPTPAPTTNQTHYGDPANGCLPGETTTRLADVPGAFCAPEYTNIPCPTNVPAGVTAGPQCAIEGAGDTSLCALICNPLAANECGIAQCQPIQGTGICTYTITRKINAFIADEVLTDIALRRTLHVVSATKFVGTPVWLAYMCPAGYCCTPDPGIDSCDIDGDGISDRMCVGNRDPAVPLCGGCLAGYSQAIDELNCVPDSECGGASSRMYALSQLAYWLAYDLYTLLQAKFVPLLLRLQWLPARIRPSSKPTAPNNGAINVVLFFFQLAQVAVPQGPDNLAAGAYAILGQLFSLEQAPQSSSGGGTCIATGTTMVHVMAWGLLAPLMPAILLLFTYTIYSLALRRSSTTHLWMMMTTTAIRRNRCSKNRHIAALPLPAPTTCAHLQVQ
jgi:hypothetical protein